MRYNQKTQFYCFHRVFIKLYCSVDKKYSLRCRVRNFALSFTLHKVILFKFDSTMMKHLISEADKYILWCSVQPVLSKLAHYCPLVDRSMQILFLKLNIMYVFGLVIIFLLALKCRSKTAGQWVNNMFYPTLSRVICSRVGFPRSFVNEDCFKKRLLALRQCLSWT